MNENQVLIYVDAYFRATLIKDGVTTIEYPCLSGTVDGIFSKETYDQFKKEIIEKYQSDGYKITLETCSKEESESEIVKNTNAPIGYIKMFILVTYEKNGEKSVQFIALDFDFSIFTEETMLDIVSPNIFRFFEEQDCKNITIETVTKEIYEKCTKDADSLIEASWDHKDI